MTDHRPAGSRDAASPRLGRTVIDDLRRGDIHTTVWRDLQDLYEFYLDEERRARLASMGRVKRAFYVVGWVLKGMFLKLTPARRLLVLLAVLLLVVGPVWFTSGQSVQVRVEFAPLSVLILLVVLMLELKDKLLARDELLAGRAVQLALLPSEQPEISGWSICTFTRPANDVGGDLIDHIPLRDGRLGVALGDVAGKGLAAALLMAKLQATLRAIAPGQESLAEVGARINQILCRDGLPNRFATLVYLDVAPDSGIVRLVNAGHLSPLVLSADGVTPIPPDALPLGVRPDENYREQRVEIAPGDALLVYSDGLSEARNARGEFFGEERLRGVLPALRGLTAAAAARRLVAEVEQFAGGVRLGDDLSLAYLQRVP